MLHTLALLKRGLASGYMTYQKIIESCRFCSIVRDKTFIIYRVYRRFFINIVTGAVNLSVNGLIIIKEVSVWPMQSN